MTEADFIAALRLLPLHKGAACLRDDAARLEQWILTTDTMVEGVHYLPEDVAGSVAWKLLAVNYSDLAAKGAWPEGILLNYPLRKTPSGEDSWDRQFLDGLTTALKELGGVLLGGDTVSLPPHAPRVISLTAIGRSNCAPARNGAHAGDALYVTGTIGDGGAGLRIASGTAGPDELLSAYRRPRPKLAEGIALAPIVNAMMDVSDGLLIDAARMADASGLGISIDLAALPLSAAYRRFAGEDRAARLAAATAGDDYQLLFAAPGDRAVPVPATRLGTFVHDVGLTLADGEVRLALPEKLGFAHGD